MGTQIKSLGGENVTPTEEGRGKEKEPRPAAGEVSATLARPGCRAPPRPAHRPPPGRGPARLAGRLDRRQIRPRGELVRGAGARAAEAPEWSPVQLAAAPSSPRPPSRSDAGRTQTGWRELGPGLWGPVPGPAAEGGAPAFPGRSAFVPRSHRSEAAIVCAPGRRVGSGPGGAAERARCRGLCTERGLWRRGAGAPGRETLRGEWGGIG